MTTAYLTGVYPAGYFIKPPTTTVSVTASGYVEGIGVYGGAEFYTIVNSGRIKDVSIYAGVILQGGGSVTNGSMANKTASIAGYAGGVNMYAPGTVVNFGTITSAFLGSYAAGVLLKDGGAVTNGSGNDTGALIEGEYGVIANSEFTGTVTNFGSIISTGYGEAAGVRMSDGGSLINGSVGDTAALVSGGRGVVEEAGSGTVRNFGRIVSTGGYDAVYLFAGRVTNGTAVYTTALIDGGSGVDIGGAPGTVINFGTVQGGAPGGFGVRLGDGGAVTNGSANDQRALVEGYANGVLVKGAPGTVANFGVIESMGVNYGYAGVSVYESNVTNGSGADHNAVIQGYYGVWIHTAAGAVSNFGAILSTGAARAPSVLLEEGGTATNGSSTDTQALISGGVGVLADNAAGSVTNFGTIQSTSGAPSSAGGYGVLLGAGGRLTNGSVTDESALVEGYKSGVTVLVAAGTIDNFGTIRGTGLGPDYGVQLARGGALVNGALTDKNASIQGYSGLSLGGVVAATNFGTISGTGGAGQFGADLGTGASLTNGGGADGSALIDGFSGAVLNSGATLTNFGTIVGLGGTAIQFDASSDVLVVEAGSAFVGSVFGGGGTLDLASGVGTLSGLLSSGGNVSVSGSMATTTFQNFGTVEVGAGATFTDAGAVTIAAGQTVNDQGTLTLGGSGKNSIVNSGIVGTTGAGVLTLAGAVTNRGTLATDGGTLTVNAAVTGTGHATINGGTLDLKSSFTQNVTFSGTTGVLELAQSQGYTGSITTLSKNGGTSLDLVDIGFVSSTEATFSGTTTSGVLTVTDGTHTARITLNGNYTASTFIASSDGHGGVTVIDPTKSGGATTPSPHQFIAAMAGLGASGGTSVHEAMATRAGVEPMLAAGRFQMTA